jgi:hypothetical protein
LNRYAGSPDFTEDNDDDKPNFTHSIVNFDSGLTFAKEIAALSLTFTKEIAGVLPDEHVDQEIEKISKWLHFFEDQKPQLI